MSKRRKAGASAFGLALVAMLVFAAFGAGAAQASTWHIDGNTFSGEESVSWSGGPVAISNQSWGITISCGTVSGTTKIKESSKSTGTITLSKCAAQGLPQCEVQPLKLNFNGSLIDSGGQAYERYDASGNWTIKGANCSLIESSNAYIAGSIASAVGVPDAVHSPRIFSAAAESATGASGLLFNGGSWKVSGEAQQSLAGKNVGKDFGTGVGGTWKPEAATWTVGGKAFAGTEEIVWSEEPSTVEIERSDGGLKVACEGSVSVTADISGGDDSSAEVILYECGIASAPGCYVGNVYLTLDGQIGKEGLDVFEKADAGGEWEMWGTGCPFTGKKPIGGSVGSLLYSEGGMTFLRYFVGEITDSAVKAIGLRVNGETWNLYTETSVSLSGANFGKEFWVQ